MKTNRFIRLISMVHVFIAWAAAGYAADTSAAQNVVPPSNAVVAITVMNIGDGPTAVPGQAAPNRPASGPAQWEEIKDLNYEMRATFFAGLQRLETKLSTQIIELNAQRANLKNPTEIKNREFALQQLEFARSYFHSLRESLGHVTPATWEQQKDKIGQAWANIQSTYTKLKPNQTI